MTKINVLIKQFHAFLSLVVLLLLAGNALAKPVAGAPPFDHTKTGFVLKDVHNTLRCEQCHVEGIFKNTPRVCSGCHALGTRVGAKPKPINHVPTNVPSNLECDTCHISGSTFLVKSYKHVGITGNCVSCHNAQFLGVSGKPSDHFPTQLPCESCHTNTGTFLSWRMDHSNVVGNCFTCHGGPQAGAATFPGVVSYSATTHAPIASPSNPGNPQDCAVCHTNYTSFVGATYDHNYVGVTMGSGTCGNCHKGQYPSVKSIVASTHIGGIPAAACDTCHTNFYSFSTATFNHTSSTGTCASCHSGQYAGVTAINTAVHIPSSGIACDACHTNALTGLPGSLNPTFAGVFFHQTTYGNPPTATCATCHSGAYLSENATAKDASHIPTTADCVTCHTAANTNTYKTFAGGMVHIGGSAPTGVACTICHSGTYITQGANAKNIGHVTTTSDCGLCHTKTNTTNYTTFLGASFSHSPGTYASFPSAAPANPTCGSCHNGSQAMGKANYHVTTTGDCIVCHINSTTGCPDCVTFYGVQYDHTNSTKGVAAYTTFPAVGSTPSPACSSCHNNTTAIGKNTGHVTTSLDCMTCHTPTSTGCSNGGLCSTFLNAVYSHTGVGAGTCGTCHQGQFSGVVSINTTTHIPQSSGNACDACHTATYTGPLTSTTLTFKTNGSYPGMYHTSSLGNNVTSCPTCHSGTYVSEGALGKNSNHISTTADCGTCHTKANTTNFSTFLGATYAHTPGTYTTFPTSTPANPTCSSCHNGTKAKGKNTGHISTTMDCLSCHLNAQTGCPNCNTFLGASGGAPHSTGFLNGKTCVSCHDGTQATGLSADVNHVPIGSADCGSCHPAYDGVGAVDFSTAAVATAANLSGGSTYGTGGKYQMNHSVVSSTACSTCHSGSYASQGLYGALGKVTNHIPTAITGSLDCTTCHKNQTQYTYTNFAITGGATMWSAETMNHNNAQGGGSPVYCVTCHLTGVTYMGKMQKKSHEGTSTAKDCSRSSCHKPLGSKGTAYSRWN